jgi:hypothetical protein
VRVLVTGDRNWTDVEKVAAVLSKLPSDTVLVHGAARGADTIAGVVGEALGFKVIPVPADWNKHGRAAGPIRNRAMLRDHGPFDLVCVFHPDLAASKGTADMVEVLRTEEYSPEKFIFIR